MKDKVCLVTGGAGSIGSALAEALLKQDPKTVRVFDNDEYGLAKLGRKITDNRMRYLLGDIRDKTRVKMAVDGVDVIFHLSAIKNVDIAEYNPVEAVKTNVFGTINLVECTLEAHPETFMFVSSDKAVDFSSLYGATKFVGEKVALWGQQITDETKFTCVRLPNIFETRGNVLEIWKEQIEEKKPLTLTSPDMLRYYMHLHHAVDFIIEASEIAKGGEIFVPSNVSELNMLELSKEYAPHHKVTGLRPGEKLRERLYTEEEEKRMTRINDMYVIQPR